MELKLDQWATTPPAGYPGTVSPPPGKRSAGFTNGEEAPAGYFNHAWDALADTQNELANLITGAGLTRSESDLTQVLAAVNRLVNRRSELVAMLQWVDLPTGPSAALGIASSPYDLVAAFATAPSLRYPQIDAWTAASVGSSYGGVFNDVCWSAALAKFVAVGTGGEIQDSANGFSFSRRATGGPDWLRCVAGANAVVAMDAAGAIKATTDGTAWTTTNASFAGATMRGLTYSPTLNRFCAVGNAAGTYPIYVGDQNGANWIAATTPIPNTSNPPEEVRWSAEAGCFFASASSTVYRSSNGMVWSPAAVPWGGPNGIQDIAALPEHLAVISKGSGVGTTPPVHVRMFRLGELNGAPSNVVELNLRVSPCAVGDTFSRVIHIPATSGLRWAGRLLGLCSNGRIRASGYVG